MTSGPRPQPAPAVAKLEDSLVARPAPPSEGITVIRRPGYGKTGKPIVLRTNYYELRPAGSAKELFRYDVDFAKELTAYKRRRVMALLLEHHMFKDIRNVVASDYRNILVSAVAVPGILLHGPGTGISIQYYDEDERGPSDSSDRINLKVHFVKKLEISKLMAYLGNPSADFADKDDILRGLNIILSKTANDTDSIISLAKKFFPLSGTPGTQPDQMGQNIGLGYLGGALIALRGYYVSTRTSISRLMVNVNVCTGAFYRSWSLRDLMRAFRVQNNSPYDLSKFIKNLRVVTSHIKDQNGNPKVKEYRIAALGRNSAAEHRFESEEGETTVAEYFKKSAFIASRLTWYAYANRFETEYGALQDPYEICIQAGSSKRPIFFPPEMCMVKPGQKFRGLLTSDQVSEMIKVACKPPSDNANSLKTEGFQQLGFNAKDTTVSFIQVL